MYQGIYLHRLFFLTLHFLLLFAIPVYIYKITGEATYLGAVFAAEWGIRLLSLTIVPNLFKLTGSLKSIIKFNCVQSGCILFLLFIYSITNNIMSLVAIGMISSIFFDINYLCIENYIQNMVLPEQLLKKQSNLQAIEQFSMVISPVIAGYFIDILSENVFIFSIGIGFLLIVFFILYNDNVSVNPQRDKLENDENNLRFSELRKGMKLIFSYPTAIKLVVLTNSVNLVYGAALALLPAIILGFYHQSSIFLGGFNFVISVIGIVSVLIFNRVITFNFYQSKSIITLLLIIVVAGIVSGGMLYFELNFIFTLFFIAVIILSDSIFSVGLRTKRQLIFKDDEFKAALPSMMLLNAISFPLGGGLVSAFSNNYNELLTMSIISLIDIIIVVFLYFLLFLFRSKFNEVH